MRQQNETDAQKKNSNRQKNGSSAIEDCLTLFVKYPQKGQIKTRLSQFIGENITRNLYKTFVADMLESIAQRPQYEIRIAFHPQSARSKVIRWLGKHYSYLPQRGSGLGERMASVLKDIFTEGFEKAIIIGSDIPDLPQSFILKAFESLSTYDAVIGPSFDGGYYLIGFRNDTFFPEFFNGIEWGTDTVFSQTLDRFKKTQTVRILPLWCDIDLPEDIKGLLKRSEKTDFKNSRTISFIKKSRKILKFVQ
jgi:rSAM/selenodomain-associated transferase 1